jgi:hypothetical protein
MPVQRNSLNAKCSPGSQSFNYLEHLSDYCMNLNYELDQFKIKGYIYVEIELTQGQALP